LVLAEGPRGHSRGRNGASQAAQKAGEVRKPWWEVQAVYIDALNKAGFQRPNQNGKNAQYVVVELKKGRGPDKVFGQLSRYMGWVKKKPRERQGCCRRCRRKEDRSQFEDGAGRTRDQCDADRV
jgi:hypothetical protein